MNTTTNELPIHLISLDTTDMSSFQDISNIDMSVKPLLSQNRLIIVCGDFSHTNDTLQQFVYSAPSLTESDITNHLTGIIDIHTQCLQEMEDSENNLAEGYKEINTVATHIRSLLNGVRLIKEVSSRTEKLLATYASHLTAILIQQYLNISCSVHIDIAESHSISEIASHIIVPLRTKEYTKDSIAAQLAQKFKVASLDIWTHRHGVMTADPSVVKNAKVIPHMSYDTALEIAYLAGEILHPSAIHVLMKEQIPINISSFSATNNPTSVISSDIDYTSSTAPSDINPYIALVTRDNFTVLSIYSAQMFYTSGYLESVFQIFKDLEVSVETLTTSEIAITMAFDSKYFSDILVARLSHIGEVHFEHAQAIISIVTKEAYWKTPSHVSRMLQHLDASVLLQMISLAQSGNNLNIVLSETEVSRVLASLHKVMFNG